MHLAVQKGRTDVVNLLLAHGDFASIRNHRGHYPSDVAEQLNFDHLASILKGFIVLFYLHSF